MNFDIILNNEIEFIIHKNVMMYSFIDFFSMYHTFISLAYAIDSGSCLWIDLEQNEAF